MNKRKFLNRMAPILCVVGLVGLLFAAAAKADAPSLLSYQGVLVDLNGSLVPDGTYTVEFAIYPTPVAGGHLFLQQLSVGVTNGLYNVILSGTELPDVFRNATQSFMQVQILAGPAGSPYAYPITLMPRQQIASVPYALVATDAANALPQHAIILWEEGETCPAGFNRMEAFDGLMIRGADVAGTRAGIPNLAGKTCSSSTHDEGCAATTPQHDPHDDTLQTAEMPSHTHTVKGHDVGGGSDNQISFNTDITPPAERSGSTEPTGGDTPHYHPFRTVIFCKKQ